MNKPAIIGAVVAVAAILAGGYATLQHREIAEPQPTEQAAGTTAEPATPALPTDVPAAQEPATATAEQAAATPAAAPTDEKAAPAAPDAKQGDAGLTLPAGTNQKNVLKIVPEDILIGVPMAPKTLFEYASLSCTHCAHFHTDILPDVKKNLIETGKVNLVFRHYPLNKPAMDGALLVECATPELRAKLLQVLFENQNKWAFTAESQSVLKNMALLAGIDNKRFEACMNDKELQKHILEGVQTATQVLKVNSTPSIFVNGKKFEEAPTATNLAKALGE